MNYVFSKIINSGLLLSLLLCSCSDDTEKDTNLYSGKDIQSYASITADTKTKMASIDIHNNGTWKLYDTNTDNSVDFDRLIKEGAASGKFDISINKFSVYCLEWSDGARAALGLRQLPIEEQPNFRDLGGYKTQEGRYVRYGYMFRSGKCNTLSDDDLSYLSTIPLKTIVDFRSNDEREQEPDKVPASVVRQINLPINPGNLSSVDIREAIAKGDIEASKQYLVDANRVLVTDFQKEYKEYFSILHERNNIPVMFHCTAGKDRAGLAAALFLSSLGVDRETVIKDYLLTNTFTDATLERMKKTYGDNDMAVCMYYIYSVQRDYIETAFSTIENKYGSVDNFLVNQLGVDIKRMKELYLY